MGTYYAYVYGRGTVEVTWFVTISSALGFIEYLGAINGLTFDKLYDQDQNIVWYLR